MALNVIFYDGYSGTTIDPLQFTPGQYIGAKFAGLDNPFDSVNLQITYSDGSSPFNMTVGIYNVFSGQAQGWFLFSLPNTVCTGKAKFTVITPFGNEPPLELDIGIGMTAPVSPNPVTSTNLITELETLGKWALIAGIGIGAIWGISKVLPSITQSAIKTSSVIAQSKIKKNQT